MPRFTPLALTVCLTSLLTINAVTAQEEPSTNAAPAPSEGMLPLEDLRTFAKVFNHIRSGYVEDVTDSELLRFAIKGMLTELDPHSAYLDNSAFENLQVNTTGEFGGLGIEIGMENGFVKVISPIDDTPASRAGVEAGDLIIKLDDKSVKGMSVSEAVENMRGPKGSPIRVTIVREGVDRPFELELVRDTVKVASVRSRMIEPGYAYLRVAQFQLDTGKEVVAAIEKLKKDNELKGMIMDLRNNPGGVLQASVEVADAFLNDGLIVYTEGRLPNGDLSHQARPGDAIDDLPLVVLINDGSASASEIVAGALQDHHRALIVGTRSFGKGSVQTVIPITEEQAIKLTTALYYTPKGRSIQAQGIEPDIFVERAQVTAMQPRMRTTEADLSNHLGNGNGGEDNNAESRSKVQADKVSLQQSDNQLYEALNLLKGITVFGQRNLPKASIARSEQADEEAVKTQ